MSSINRMLNLKKNSQKRIHVACLIFRQIYHYKNCYMYVLEMKYLHMKTPSGFKTKTKNNNYWWILQSLANDPWRENPVNCFLLRGLLASKLLR